MFIGDRVRTIPNKAPNSQYPIILAYPNAKTNTGVWWNTELNASQKLCKSIYYTY